MTCSETAMQDWLFYLLRSALDTYSGGMDLSVLSSDEWKELIDLSFEQGVAAIAVDGLQKLREAHPDMEISLDAEELIALRVEWFGEVLACEKDYNEYVGKMQKLLSFYRSMNIPTIVLKGYGLSLNYPVPSHRLTGDLDIYQFGHWKKADALVAERFGVKVDNSHHHHSVFLFRGLTVENHYDFFNVHSHRSNVAIEKILKNNAAAGQSVDCVDLPTSDFNALFVIRHIAAHFAADGMNMRQLLDWTMFVRSHSIEVNWPEAWNCYRKWNMHKFVLCIDELAVKYLGVDRKLFGIPDEFADFGKQESNLVLRTLNEMLYPTVVPSSKRNVFAYVSCRFRRWWLNRWKHKLVYSDSLLSTFMMQAVSHLMKPATLIGK